METGTTIYVWYDKPGKSQPESDSTYGSEGVWSNNYNVIQHMNSLTPLDSTSNDVDGTKMGNPSLTSVMIGGYDR